MKWDVVTTSETPVPIYHSMFLQQCMFHSNIYEGWKFNSGNYLFTTDTK